MSRVFWTTITYMITKISTRATTEITDRMSHISVRWFSMVLTMRLCIWRQVRALTSVVAAPR